MPDPRSMHWPISTEGQACGTFGLRGPRLFKLSLLFRTHNLLSFLRFSYYLALQLTF